MRDSTLFSLLMFTLVTPGLLFDADAVAQDAVVASPSATDTKRAKVDSATDTRKAEQDLDAATTPVPRDMPWWKQRHESMNQKAREQEWEIVFMGDSITQGWEGPGKEVWKKYYGERSAGNLGISGDETEHLAWRLENGNLEGQSPRVAVVMIGTNNLGNVKHSPQAVIKGIEKVVATVREQSPKTQILLLGVFPRGEKPDDPYREQIKEVNEGIRQFAENKENSEVHFLDIAKAFLEEDGLLSKQVMPDFLHLSPEGYERWAKGIEPALEKLLGADEDSPSPQ